MKLQPVLKGQKEDRRHIIWTWLIPIMLLISLSSISLGEESVEVSPSSISISANPGDFAEAWLTIRNNLSMDVNILVDGLDGKVLYAVPAIDRIRVKVPAEEEGSIRIKGYVPKTAKYGIYTGEVILNVDGYERRIPITVEIRTNVENVSLELRIHPVKSEIAPGDILYIQSDITNLGKKTVNAELRLQLIDPDTNEVILTKSDNISIETVISVIPELNASENIKEKRYKIEGILYYTSETGEEKILDYAESSVTVKKRISDFISQILAEFTLARILLIIFLVIAFILVYLYYANYKREAIRRKRYLESINFDALPKPGSNSGFIGRIAETNTMAFMDLNSLQTHGLIAGATGCGKTVVAQIISEEALLKGKSVIVFDPTAQWSGFLRANKDKSMLRLYRNFHMKKENAMPFKGNVYVVADPGKRMEIERHIKPGEITIFYLKNMDTTEMETFVSNAIDGIAQLNLEESQDLKTLLIFDEVHRMLPKFGGSGRGLLYIEKATREFRKWGIGIVLISQVIKDFTGVIQANIGSEVQMQTRYENDLNRIKTKYGEDIKRSIVKANVGSGMIQNSEYNKGLPYFVSFRPLLHSPNKLSNEELQLYEKYNLQMDDLISKFNEIKNAGMDVFDIELELNLTQDSITEGSFGVVDLYMASLSSRIGEYYNRIKNKQVTAEDLVIRSEWDILKKKHVGSYENELGVLIEKENKALEEKEKITREKEEAEKKRIDEEQKRLSEEERRKREEIEKKRVILKSESRVLDLLREHEKRVPIRDDVRAKEEDKLKIKEEELKRKNGEEEKRLEEEKRRKLEEEKQITEYAKKRREFINSEAQRVGRRWEEITADKEMILERDKEIVNKEEKLAEDIKSGIRDGIEKKKRIRDELISERSRLKQEELKKTELELSKDLEEERERINKEGKERRKEYKEEKDKLQKELQTIKERWKEILDRERKIREKKEELEQKMGKWYTMVNGERRKIEAGMEGGDWKDFELMENEWKKMDQWNMERKKLEEELETIRKELKMQKGLRLEEEKEFKGKKEELIKLGEKAGITEVIYEELGEEKFETEAGGIPIEEEQKLKEREGELVQKLNECDATISDGESRIEKMKAKGESWEDFESMEREWKKMDDLRAEREKIDEELNEIRRKLGK